MSDVVVGVLEADILLGDVHSLKHKRAVVRPILARLRRLEVSAAECGDQDVHRRALLAVAVVSGDGGHLRGVLDRCERQIAGEAEIELLSVRRRIASIDDL